MQLFVKPEPTEAFFKLSGRESSIVAMKVAKDAGGGETDWQVFREWTRAWKQRNRSRNLTLV